MNVFDLHAARSLALWHRTGNLSLKEFNDRAHIRAKHLHGGTAPEVWLSVVMQLAKR